MRVTYVTNLKFCLFFWKLGISVTWREDFYERKIATWVSTTDLFQNLRLRCWSLANVTCMREMFYCLFYWFLSCTYIVATLYLAEFLLPTWWSPASHLMIIYFPPNGLFFRGRSFAPFLWFPATTVTKNGTRKHSFDLSTKFSSKHFWYKTFKICKNATKLMLQIYCFHLNFMFLCCLLR